ncbi:Protein RRP5 [Thoreauomyces humboldtii]|nr:Protein RRP5 [Thoreauomyces humboldtii]
MSPASSVPAEKKHKAHKAAAVVAPTLATPEAAPGKALSKPLAEESFPRGGASALTPLEYREVSDQAKQDVLFEQTDVVEEKPKRVKKRRTEDTAAGESSKKARTEETTSYAEALSFKRLNIGMTMIGCVKEINDLDIAISLPDQLTGYVSIAEISEYVTKAVEKAAEDDSDEDDEGNEDAGIPELRDLFAVGQIVSCVITALEHDTVEEGSSKPARKRVVLSLKPETVNANLTTGELTEGLMVAASVSSEEDHGYVLSFGISGVSGFLLKKNAAAYIAGNGNRPLKVGQVVYASVLKADDAKRIVSVTLSPETITKAVVPTAHAIGFDALKAGALVNAKVKQVLENGILLSFLGILEGTANLFHVGVTISDPDTDLAATFKVGQKMKARILFVDPIRKKIGLTLTASLLQWAPHKFPSLDVVDIGTVIDEFTVVRIDAKLGVLVQAPEAGLAFVHVSRLADKKVEKVETKFKIGSKHRGRVLGFDHCGGLLQVTFQKSVIEQPFVRHNEIKVGMLVKGTVAKLTPAGVIISISGFINGFCPKIHFADVALSQPEKMFKEGAAIKCQVLSVDVRNKRVILTHKKSLMNSTLPQISSYADAKEGDLGHGVITGVKDFGCLVTFYNNVRALVPLAELSDKYIKKASDHFTVGQTVKCRVLSTEPEEEKMRASFRLLGKRSAATANLDAVSIGQVLAGVVVGILGEGVLVEFRPSMLRGYLAKAHLTDHITTVDRLFKSLREGTVLKELAIIGKDETKGHLRVTMKGLLVQDLKRRKTALKFEDLKEDLVVPGYILNVTDKGAFVGFPGSMVGMAKLRNLSDRYVAQASDVLQSGQTVVAVITNVDAESRRVEVSLKHSLCVKNSDAIVYETDLLRSLFQEQDLANFVAPSQDKVKAVSAWAGSLKIGDIVSGTVKKAMPYGVIVDLEDGVSGLITNAPTGDAALKIGEVVKGKIMDVSAERKIVDLIVIPESSLSNSMCNTNPEIVKQAKRHLDKAAPITAVVQVVKEDYGILTIAGLHGAVAYASAKNLNATGAPFTKFRVGQELKVKVTSVPFLESSKGFEGFTRQRMLVVPLFDNDQPQDVLDGKRTIKGAVDPNFRSIEELTLGARIKATIIAVKENQLNMSLGSNLKGRVHITQIAQNLEDIKDKRHPLATYAVGETIECKVIGFHDAKNHHSLPFSHRKNASQTVVELTINPSELALPDFTVSEVLQELPTLETLQRGTAFLGFVQSVDDDAVWLHIAPNLLGRAHLLDCPDPAAIRKPHRHFPVGSAVQCYVSRVNPEKRILDLSFRVPGTEDEAKTLSLDSIKVGQIITGRVKKVESAKGLSIQVSPSLHGRVHLTDISDNYNKDPTAEFRIGTVVQCCVIHVDSSKGQLDLSLRPSRVTPKDHEDVVNPEIKTVEDVASDSVVSGYIRHVSLAGCFVALNGTLSARVKIAELSDAFIKEWADAYKPGQLVQGRIVSVDYSQSRVEMSLKQSVVDPASLSASQVSWKSLKVGQKVKGTVKSIKEYGVFVQLANSPGITGLCHKSELSDAAVNMIEKLYSVGDAVIAVVLKVNTDTKKLSLGLKASYFDEKDLQADEEQEDEDVMDVDKVVETEGVVGMDIDGVASEDDDDEEEQEDEDSMEVDVLPGAEGESEDEDASDDSDDEELAQNMFQLGDDSDEVASDADDVAQGLEVAAFDWTGAAEDDVVAGASEDDDSDTQGEANSLKKKSRRAKLRAKQDEEERIAQKEMSLLDGEAPPEVAEDFERLLLGSPNSSFLWIKFMAFQLQMAEVDKARAVAERALKSIGFREEQEKMNVWVALMNLENGYGTHETLTKVFERAIAMNEPEKVYLQLIRIYERTEKWDEAERLWTVATKKFNKSSKVWTGLGLFQLRRGKVEEARKTLQRSLQSLAKRKHVKTICKFAQMEFKYGEPERGRTIFEGIMSNYPKRIDLWSVYLDMETRNGDVAITRRLFERVIANKFSSKKMKFFFKKFLDFEKRFGTPETIDNVKQAAVAYVESLQ